MKCLECRFDNPEGAKFCSECGKSLRVVCEGCGKENTPGSEFCACCGRAVTRRLETTHRELPFSEKLDRLQKYLPKGIVGRILSHRFKIEGERKQVTVMFCDMVGFTPLVETLGPEASYHVMDQVYEILIHKVHDYGGTINEMTGDGIMALFGAPMAVEDAPLRAIRSASAIHREMTGFTKRIKHEKGELPAIRMRIGIHTGPVVVGALGNDLRVEFKAVGDTVNLASRTQSLADPGTTYVTEETFKLTEGLFRFEALGEKKIKGKEKPVKIYQVIALSARRTRFEVSAERGLTPLVGRSRELELLLEGLERVKAGKGEVFSIVSEAGCGKSRLLYEFRKGIVNENALLLEGKCLSYGKGASYYPHIEILKSSFNLQEGEGDQQIREKLANGLKAIGADEVTTLPYLLELLSVKDSGIDRIPVGPEAKKEKIGEAIKQIIVKASEIRPMIIAIEDLHWVDRSSEDILRAVLEIIPGLRVMVILTYRPDFIPPWESRSYHSRLTLHKLSKGETLEMITRLLGSHEIEEALANFLLEKTEGVPFFIEEFIKSYSDLKIIKKSRHGYHLSKEHQRVMIPSTIQDVIMARVDCLPEPARELVQTVSVVQREFSYLLIRIVSGLPEEDLLSLLAVLKESELICERGVSPKSVFAFKHALTREVVYDSILTAKKRSLHERIGQAIETIYSGEVQEHYEMLAGHFTETENHEKAARYSKLAAKKCEKTGSMAAAIEHAGKWIAVLEKMPRSNDVQKEIMKARVTLGLYHSQILDFSSAKNSVDPIVEIAVKGGDRRTLSQIYTILGAHDFFLEDDVQAAFRHLGDALTISEEIKDAVSLLMGNYWMGVVLAYHCEFDKALAFFDKSLQINKAANSLWGMSTMKSSISYFVHYFRGDMDTSHRMGLEAVDLAEKSGDSFSKAMAYASYGSACYGRGLLEDATQALFKAIEACERASMSNWNASVHFCLGEIFCDLANYEKAKAYYAKAILILEENKVFPSWTNMNRLAFARARAKHGEREIDLRPFYEYVAVNKIRLCEGTMARYLGETLVAMDDQNAPKAQEWIQNAILADRRNGLMLHLGRDFRFLGELRFRRGENHAAVEAMERSIELFRNCGAMRDIQEAEKSATMYGSGD
ncbi:MAG: AAA family ATPase [Desulfobacterota bacterium]|nr:AAA family ATPase [Thermodesulfobacteriota bacterium]